MPGLINMNASQQAHMRASTVRVRAVVSMFVVEAVLRDSTAALPVTGAVTNVDSFSFSFLRAALSLVLRASPKPSVDFMVVTAAASLARILVWTTTLELRRRADLIRKKETTRGSNKGHGMYVLCRTGEERTSKVNARRGKA
jgi:hypothetical protein